MEMSDAGGFTPALQEAKGCAYYFLKLDEEVLRPLLIYKYDEERAYHEEE